MTIELKALEYKKSEQRIIAVAMHDNKLLVMHYNKHNGYFVYDQEQKLTEADVKAFANKVFPPTRCQHEHDCCGNFYLQYNSATFVDDDVEGDIWRIESHYIQNI